MSIVIYWAYLPLIAFLLSLFMVLAALTVDEGWIARNDLAIVKTFTSTMFLSVMIGLPLAFSDAKLTVHLMTAAEKRQAIHETYQSLVEEEKVEKVSNAED